jgi:hypothetical protein
MGYGVVDQDGVAIPEGECPSTGTGKNPVVVKREGCVQGVDSV